MTATRHGGRCPICRAYHPDDPEGETARRHWRSHTLTERTRWARKNQPHLLGAVIAVALILSCLLSAFLAALTGGG